MGVYNLEEAFYEWLVKEIASQDKSFVGA